MSSTLIQVAPVIYRQTLTLVCLFWIVKQETLILFWINQLKLEIVVIESPSHSTSIKSWIVYPTILII